MADAVTRLCFLTLLKKMGEHCWRTNEASQWTSFLLHNADTYKHLRSIKMSYPAWLTNKTKLLAQIFSSVKKGGRAQLWCRGGKPSNVLMNHRWQCGCYIGPEGKTIISQSFLEIRNNSQWSLNLCQWDGSASKGCCCQLNDLSTYTKGSPNPCKLSFNLPKHMVMCASHKYTHHKQL